MGNTKKMQPNSKSNDRHKSQLLTCDEVCERLRITRRTFFSWAKRAYFPAMKMGGQWRVDRDELASFIRSTHNQQEKTAA